MVIDNQPKTTTKRVKLFKNGASQAVRLPADFRFEGNEIFATRNNESGVVTLSQTAPEVPDRWAKFYEILQTVDPNDPEVQNYMSERPLNRQFRWRSVLDHVSEEEFETASEVGAESLPK